VFPEGGTEHTSTAAGGAGQKATAARASAAAATAAGRWTITAQRTTP
jgi:hypothetical protein